MENLTFLYEEGQQVKIIEEGWRNGQTGTITIVDYDDPCCPYQVTFPDGDTAWFADEDIQA